MQTDSSTGSIVSTVPWIPNDEPIGLRALVVVGELDLEVAVLAAEREAERRLTAEQGGLRWQVSAATAGARRQHHHQDAGHGKWYESPDER